MAGALWGGLAHGSWGPKSDQGSHQWSPNLAGEQAAHTQFFSLKRKERNPSECIKDHTPGAGGWRWWWVRTMNSLLFLLRTHAGLMRQQTWLPRASARLVGEDVGAEGVPPSGHLLKIGGPPHPSNQRPPLPPPLSHLAFQTTPACSSCLAAHIAIGNYLAYRVLAYCCFRSVVSDSL